MNLGLYYLKSRYYDPETGRFINADGYISTGQGLTGYNMFAYCNNNPVIYTDNSGTSPSHVMVSLHDGGGSPSNDGITISRYSLSFCDVVILQGKGIDDKTKEMYAAKYPNSIIVIDGRFCNDKCIECNPNMQIYNSYKITDTSQQREILELLHRYDKLSPSRHDWGRTVDSIMVEWEMHNNHYYSQLFHFFDKVFGKQTCISAKHVDFDKESEGLSKIRLYFKAL